METAAFVDPKTMEHFSLDSPIWRAPNGNPLMLTPLPGISRKQIKQNQRSIWRYQAALPCVIDQPISLGEGCTPLVNSSFKGNSCQFKLEWFSPTGSFKDRGASVLISFLKQMGITSIVEDSSGNGGAAIACYGVAAGMKVKILIPEATEPDKIIQTRAYGADVEIVRGSREDTQAAAIKMAADIFYAGHNWHPFFLQGTKSLGYEIWEDLGFRVPDNIVMPVSAGSILIGCFMAFTELMSAGEITRLPKFFVTQPAHCAPLHASFKADVDFPLHSEVKRTIAEGAAIKNPVRLRECLHVLQKSGGDIVTLEECEIADACRQLARQGLFCEPTSALAAAGFAKLIENSKINNKQETIVILTGSGLKARSFFLGPEA